MCGSLLRAACGCLLSVSLLPAARFSGSVTDTLSGKPIPGAFVTVGSKVVRAGANGEFEITGEGTDVKARAYGYGRSSVITQDKTRLHLKLTPITPRALYLSFWGVGSASVREPVLHLTTATPVNAVVIDIKGDLGYISYRTAVPLAGKIGAQKITTIPDLPALIARLHKQGIYTIGRIVTFKDNALCSARPQLAVHRNGTVFKDREGLTWCDPFRPEVRQYNIDIAEDAAKAGFDEIQFDYVRFPDTKGVEFSQPSTEESRPKAITSFLAEARQRLTPYNVFLSADVFGYICWNKSDTGIGQRIDDLASVLDYICPMLYPSGFLYGIPDYRNPIEHPYQIVRFSLDRARERTKIDPVRFRPWLQAFADYAFDRRQFGEKEMEAQIRAAQSFGADGWILWNARNVYSADIIRTASRKSGPEGQPANASKQTAVVLQPAAAVTHRN